MQKQKDTKIFDNEEQKAMTELIMARAGQKGDIQRINRLADILVRGGALSFPHTFLKENIDTYLDICHALHQSGRTELVLVGVLHSNDPRDIEKEFSLENFEYVLRMHAEANGFPEIPIRKRSFPLPVPKATDIDAWERHMAYLRGMKEELVPYLTGKTALLTTGDLCHYGHGYAAYYAEQVTFQDDPEPMLAEKIRSLLDTLYTKGDYRRFAEDSRVLLGDHVPASIVVKELLGKQTAFEIFKLAFSDYSAARSAAKPTLVASVFYGAYPL